MTARRPGAAPPRETIPGRDEGERGRALRRLVSRAEGWLTGIYRLETLGAERFLVAPEDARELLPPGSPRTGVLILEEGEELWLGLYVDPEDQSDTEAILEETSHVVCLAWHAAQGLPVSPLVLELQSEIDRFAVARLAGRDPFAHFERFRWAPWLRRSPVRHRYERAHRAGLRYCRFLAGRYPGSADTPGLLDELRRFYRGSAAGKLQMAERGRRG